jgi:cyclophilin family peptidyl-prolyl cis-trans isomerase/thioredoxin-related protein
MRSVFAVAAVSIALVCFALAGFAGEGWLNDFAKAQEQAKSEKKDLLVNFCGSDWCGWCQKLEQEIFGKKEFVEQAKAQFVLVIVDNPRSGPTPADKKLIEKYDISGFPTVFLMFSDGTPYAKIGYIETSPADYFKRLGELQAKGKEFALNLAKTDKGTPAEMESAMAAVIDHVGENSLPAFVWSACAERLIAGDPDNKKGQFMKAGTLLAGSYFQKREMKKLREICEKLVKFEPSEIQPYFGLASALKAEGKFKEAAEWFEKAYQRKSEKTSPQEWVPMLLEKGACLFAAGQCAESKAAYQAILDSEIGPKIDPKFRGQVDGFIAACDEYPALWKAEEEIRAKEKTADNNPIIEIKTDKGTIKVELFEDSAPNTVANFISLVEKKFFDGLKFHRVIPGFMIQGGDPNGDGSGGPGYSFNDELSDGYRRHFTGSLSMANSGPNTNGSQFFITHVPTSWLNGRHVVFGRVIEGLDVIYQIAGGDKIVGATVLRKRAHIYEPKVTAK